MNSFDIYSVEYQPKRIFFTREVRKALKKAFADAIVRAFAITLLVASCMDLDKLLEQLL